MTPAKTCPIAVVVVSDSDLPVIEACLETLKPFDILHELRVLPAHKTPEAVG